jgi:predicted exporter
MKYINFIILFILLGIGIIFKNDIHISTNLLSLFASKSAIEKLNIADKLGYSREMLIAVKGFDDSSKSKVKDISEKLANLQDVSRVQSTFFPSAEIVEYYKKQYLILATFNSEVQTKSSVYNKLKELYDAQFTNVFYSPIDKNDPLKLFDLKNEKTFMQATDGEFIKLGNYGYLIKVTTNISPSQMGKAKVLYDNVKLLLNSYQDVTAFAPFFYTVENSQKIKNDVKWIVLLSGMVLLLVYYLLLKNISLLIHTLVALGSSMLFAILVSSLFLDELNALSLAFGMTITAVSIDYLLHYYFHDFYKNKDRVDKNVFYGFLTTVAAFGIFSFIPIPMISQISLFAALSLFFAYVLFTFVFPLLKIEVCHVKSQSIQNPKKVPAYIFFILSALLLVYSLVNMKLDDNIRNLDYQNTKLQKIEELFKNRQKTELFPVMVKATTKDELISELHKLQDKIDTTFSFADFIPTEKSCLQKIELLNSYNFNRLNKMLNEEALKIGYKRNYFKNAYKFINSDLSCTVENLNIFKFSNLALYHDQKEYYTLAFVSDTKAAQELKSVESISIKDIFKEISSEMYKNLLFYSLIVVAFIIVSLIFFVKHRFLYALNYILFPASLVLFVLSTNYEINIMHIFSLVILIAIGIDFGIYMSNTSREATTMLAIKYSLLSTFGAFGVLIFSSIVALNSIGLVVSLGIAAIYILMKVMK